MQCDHTLGFERILKQITHMGINIHYVEIPTVGRSTRMHLPKPRQHLPTSAKVLYCLF